MCAINIFLIIQMEKTREDFQTQMHTQRQDYELKVFQLQEELAKQEERHLKEKEVSNFSKIIT
jgi:hypothetical protein